MSRSISESSVDWKLLLIIGAVGAGILLLMKGITAAKTAVASVTAPVSNAISDAYTYLTSQGAMIPQGSILLPDGFTWIPISSVNVNPQPTGNGAQFSYAGTVYYLNSGHDANGNYDASSTPAG